MTYFDDNEDKFLGPLRPRRRVSGTYRSTRPNGENIAKIAREALAAPPGSPLAKARIAAHAAFDPLWKHGPLSRRAAYDWLAIKLRLHRDDTHMVLFDEATCQRVVWICNTDPTCRAAQALADPINDFEDLTK